MTVPIIPLSAEETVNWSSEEMAGVTLGDKRLNKRTVEVLEKLGKHPSGSIPYGCDEWADTKATYELFKNEKVTAEKLRKPHQDRTWARVREHACVLAAQDTSFLNYSHYKKIEGLGSIGTKEQNLQGIVMHNTMAVTPEGVSLGNLHQMLWVRS
ncbi:MAG: transposase, partial [Chloroflexi bacterium]|nr:transposase [Chloroflexota bacterium]